MGRQTDVYETKLEFLKKEKEWCQVKISLGQKAVSACQKRLKDLDLQIGLLMAKE